MSWSAITIVGLLAALASSIGYIPQVIRIYRTRQVRDIALGMCLLQSTSTLLWLIYGLLVFDSVIITSNSIVAIQILFITITKIWIGEHVRT